MKKLIIPVILTALLPFLIPAVATAAPKPFEGIITYKITYPDSKFTESQLAMFPKLVTVSVKGTKSRTQMQMNGMSTVEIKDYDEKTSVTLLDIMGQKMAIKKTSADIEKEMKSDATPSVQLTNETKVIAGYMCKKAIITINDDGKKSVFEAFFTEELGGNNVNFDNPIFKDIKGVMLEFSLRENEMNMLFTATSVDKKSISSKEFEIPSDYKPTTLDEMKNMFGGGNE